MMMRLLNKMGLSDNRAKIFIEKFMRIKMVISAAFYILMVFIVIFGISGDVYAGFPKAVPYFIMAIFMFMAFIRMYQCLVDDRYVKRLAAQKSESKAKKNISAAESTGNASETGSAEAAKTASEVIHESEEAEIPAVETDGEQITDKPE